MNRQDFNHLNSLLNRYTTSSVQLRRDRRTEALDSWKPIVDDILDHVKEREECFAKLQIFNSGSYYERTKVGEPDEFDLMLVMENVEFLELSIRRYPDLSKPPTGFTRGGMTYGDNHYMYSATEVKALFSRLVREAVRELECESFVTVRSQGPAVTLKITNKNGQEYSIDLTLAIKHESWPNDAKEWRRRSRTGWPNQQLVQEIYHDGCHLVAKHPKRDDVTEQEKEFLWRYSFSEPEKKLFLQAGDGEASSCQKQVLRILKSLREELNLEPLNSYHLKTILFYECEANPLPSQWSSNNLGKRFVGLLFRLLRCLQQSNCPHYFIENLNLFEAFTPIRCQNLALKVIRVILKPEEVLNKLIKKSQWQSLLEFLRYLRQRQIQGQNQIDFLEYVILLLNR